MSVSQGVKCDHCGLPVPAGLVEPEAEHQFCCNGCKMVFEAIRGCGLDRYYAIKDDLDDTSVQGRTTGKQYEEFDDGAFADLYVRPAGENLHSIELYLESVHCAACVWLIERLGQVVKGVIQTRLDYGRSLARIVWDPEVVKLSTIARTLDSLGYPCHPYRGVKTRDVRRREDRSHLIRIGIAGACAMNVMVIAFGFYDPNSQDMDPVLWHAFRWASLGLTLLSLLWPGRVFYVGALASWRTRMMHMDVPVALALTLGMVWNALNTVRGVGDVYFESLSAVIFLLLIGRWIQHKQQRAAHDAVELLCSLTPVSARKVDPDTGDVQNVPVEALQSGDRVEVRSGDSIPVDGVVVEGASDLDAGILTGESRPVPIGANDLVHAGTVNLSRRLVVEVHATGEATRIGRLMQLVEQSAKDRPPVVRLADRIAHWFVIAVVFLAALTFGGWVFVSMEEAVDHAVTLLIVTCPCALGLATPLAVIASVGRAAQRGILIKGGSVVEQLARSGLLLLDKTGTLTAGRMELVHWYGDDAAKALLLAAEREVSHPIAAAVVRSLEESHSAPAEAMSVDVSQHLGGGLTGQVAGSPFCIGSPKFVQQQGCAISDEHQRAVEDVLGRALTPVLIARNGAACAVAGFGDPVRDDAPAIIARLQREGWQVRIISGDHPQVVHAVGAQLGLNEIDCMGALAPEDKLHIVQEAVRGAAHPVVMVGDGANDAAALAAADVGVAVHGGAEASLAAADVFFTTEGLDRIEQLIDGSRATMGVIRGNLGVSLGYNLVAGTLAIAGVINPLLAAVLMPISSLTVVTLSYRSRTFGA
jgi:Cu2+-exporting ATPase